MPVAARGAPTGWPTSAPGPAFLPGAIPLHPRGANGRRDT
jgi:hypothetical protein